MVAVLSQEKLVGHAGDVIADDNVARNDEGLFLVIWRHGAAVSEKEMEKSLQTLNGVVAVFGDDRMRVQVSDEELFQTSILLSNGVT